jgi:UDP-N-acetylglucosamine--N-acetylmuramyl-(pentapeptide) pyrophosphoryl-undecaprenol N-acetylglucosamine transferase
MSNQKEPGLVAVACGGTGGHLFPGMAVAERLLARGCAVTLLVSPKEIDRRGTALAPNLDWVTLPAVGLERGRWLGFLRGLWRSYWVARRQFRRRRPAAVLAMGGFTSAAPILAGRDAGSAVYLHEANGIPGRANRWLARWVDCAFVGFPQAAARLRHCRIEVTGTPVRQRFQPRVPWECRLRLGLDPDRPVLLVMGGSQGARGVNELVLATLPILERQLPQLQILHVTGEADFGRVRDAYARWGGRSVIREFLGEMELAMSAATVAISRAGGSAIAEMAAVELPSILVPYPSATDDHQFYNARALADTGGARMLEETLATPQAVAVWLREMVSDELARQRMREALRRWHRPDAAERVADWILSRMGWATAAGSDGSGRSEEFSQRTNGGASLAERGVGVAPSALAVAEREPQWSGRR